MMHDTYFFYSDFVNFSLVYPAAYEVRFESVQNKTMLFILYHQMVNFYYGLTRCYMDDEIEKATLSRYFGWRGPEKLQNS
jgi:hypothetical protein